MKPPYRYGRCALAGLLCCLGLLLGRAPAGAQTKLIIIPTAQILGANRYTLAAQYRGVLFGVSPEREAIKTKIGLGERADVGVDYSVRSGSGSTIRWNAKYVWPVARETAIGVGFEALGKQTRWVPYALASHTFPAFRLTVGVADAKRGQVVFAGVDGNLGSSWRWMSDYNTSADGYASVGLQYTINERWSTKFGTIFEKAGRNDVKVEITYHGWY